jgi:putative FmdB family regulatory protein
MPFYEYECQNCKFYTELMQKISDPPLEKCPSCGKKTMQKLISAPVFRLKGSGWYETDFKGDNESKRNLAGAEKEEPKSETAAADSAKGADTKTDAKPAPAAESKPAAEPGRSPGQPKRESASSGSGKRASSSGGSKARSPEPAKGKSKQAAKTASKPSAKSKAKAKAKGKAKGRR